MGKAGNPNWKKGGPSPNPGGRPKSYLEFVTALREQHHGDALKALGSAIKLGDSWAVQLGLAYMWGKPNEAAADLTKFTDAQIEAELERRLQERQRAATSAAPALAEEHAH